MYYRKLFCIFFAVVFLFSTVSVVVAQDNGIRKFRSNHFNIKIGSARPLGRFFSNSRLASILENFFPHCSAGLIEYFEDPAEESDDEEPKEEEPEEEGIPPEDPEKSEEEDPEEEESEEEQLPPDLDLSIVDIDVDEDVSGNCVHVEVCLKYNDDAGSVRVSDLSLGGSLCLFIKTPSGEELRYGSFSDDGSFVLVTLDPGDMISTVVDVVENDDIYLSKGGLYEIWAHYKSVEASNKETEQDLELDLTSPVSTFEITIDRPTINAMNEFAFKLFKEFRLPQIDGGAKVVGCSFSPTIAFSEIAMMMQGAAGETANQMADVLGVQRDDAVVLRTMRALYDDYNFGSEISRHNGLWFDSSYQDYVSPYFLDTINEFLGYSDYYLDFSKKAESLDTINSWIKDKSHGNEPKWGNYGLNIKDLENRIFPVTASTIYSKLKWQTSFDPEKTEIRDFQPVMGDTAPRVPFMNFHGYYENLGYTKTDKMQILELPCQGGEISMLFMLPRNGYDVGDIYDNLNTDNLRRYMELLSEFNWNNNKVHISIPKFGIGGGPNGGWHGMLSYDLKDYLRQMGMNKAFSNDADFSNMISEDESVIFEEESSLCIPNVYHTSYIGVNETGTESASAPYLTSYDSQVPFNPQETNPNRGRKEIEYPEREPDENNSSGNQPNGDIHFNANHPFIFMIQHKTLGTILFMGSAYAIIISPLVLDTAGDDIKTSGLDHGVLFDLNNDGKKDLTGWTTAGSDDSFLALDLDCNGYIDDGGELFGDNTLLFDGSKASNGFEALSQYDKNKDKIIDSKDAVWSDLLLWSDTNHNGISEKEELTSVIVSCVDEIFLDYSYLNKLDNGNLLRECSSFTNKNGSTYDIIDIWFQAITG